MLLVLLISHLTVLAVGNPFHKYPFVFLLDVGNEELEKTNTEQIRVYIPGGSLALRYPAIGDGETIAHVRVSGIDFGTDLKANIIDGGPGYKYVVLVFMGNRGVPYDAVVTIQTLLSETVSDNVQNIVSASNNGVSYTVSEEINENNSAEDMSDSTDDAVNKRKAYIGKSNAELMQSSSNVYKYAQSKVIENDDYSDATSNDLQGEKDTLYSANSNQFNERNVETEDNVENNYDDGDEIGGDPKAEKYGEEDHSYDEGEPIRDVESNLYEKKQEKYLYDDTGYREDAQDQNVIPVYQYTEDDDDDDSIDIEQIFNDDEDQSDAEKYQDSNNNNYVDSDDSSAVAY